MAHPGRIAGSIVLRADGFHPYQLGNDCKYDWFTGTGCQLDRWTASRRSGLRLYQPVWRTGEWDAAHALLLNELNVFGVNLLEGFLWQALIVLLYWGWLFVWSRTSPTEVRYFLKRLDKDFRKMNGVSRCRYLSRKGEIK